MLKIYSTFVVLISTLARRASDRLGRSRSVQAEAGFGTLEWVLITLFVLGAATAAVAVVGGAITTRTGQIS